jgi:hypothetical protein
MTTSLAFDSDDLYLELLKLQVRGVLATGEREFWSLVRLCGGAYPVELVRALSDLERAQLVMRVDDVYRLPLSADTFAEPIVKREIGAPSPSHRPILPCPHPLDYDWRFTEAASKLLLRKISAWVRGGKGVGIWGAPSVFLECDRAGLSSILVDRNSMVTNKLGEVANAGSRVICADLFEPLDLCELPLSIVLADPPWYSEYYEAFILRASEVLDVGGIFLLSMLPWLTRPSAVSDRGRVMEYCRRAGFDLVECCDACLGYETPPFECASLHAEGLDCEQWRLGDLYSFRKVGQPEGGLQVSRPVAEPRWRTFELGELIVKLRERTDQANVFSFETVVSGRGAVLNSVSRRAPERSHIDLWTSDNRAYSLSRLDVVGYALSKLREQPLEEALQSVRVKFNLSTQEQGSLSALLHEIISLSGATLRGCETE